ncbi:hypothetical protein [Cellulomonas soli]
MLDCELLPWSAKALDLITAQYASVGEAARHALPEVLGVLDAGAARGLDLRDRRTAAGRRPATASSTWPRPTSGVRPPSGGST